jgi:hypothetical protein
VEAATEDYPEIHDLLNRFRTLKEANRDLTLAQIRDEGENEALRDEYGGYTKARANEMLDGNNHVSGLQKNLERGVHEAYLLQVMLLTLRIATNPCIDCVLRVLQGLTMRTCTYRAVA